MKRNTIISTVMVIMAFSSVPVLHAQSDKDPVTAQDVKKETQALVGMLEQYTFEQRDAAIDNAEKAIKDIDRRIDLLETRIDKNWGDMTQTARQKTQANIKTLRKERNELTDWYESFKNSSVDAWNRTKKGFSEAYQAVSDSWGKAKKEYDTRD